MSKDILRRLPLFANLSDADLNQIYQSIESVAVPAGSVIIREGDPGDALYVIIDGEFEITKRSKTSDVLLDSRGAGDFVGELAILERVPRAATVRALRDSEVLRVPSEAVDQLFQCSSDARHAILSVFAARLRGMEAALQQSQKMAALGQLSAGLAHELNNPAAALKRGTDHLIDLMSRWQEAAVEFGALTLDTAQRDRLTALHATMTPSAETVASLDPLARADLESDVQTWLEQRGVAEAWDLAPALVDLGWDTAVLENVADGLSDAQVAIVAPWLGLGLAAHSLLAEMSMSANRISEIVKAVKSYSYLDQAPIQEVDVIEGLENTLVILRHKLRHGITIKREYASHLPRIQAFASELNQVWTNIIDNAIDAMRGQGELTIRVYGNENHVVVEIADNGPGIPPDVQARVFEPFFTTKPPGSGTGLGLHISYSIIAHQHKGRMSVMSRPGETCFQVVLPVDPFGSSSG